MTDLSIIEEQARRYADALRRLADGMAELDAEIAHSKKRYMPRIKRLAAAAATQKAELRSSLAAADFERPRTRVLHGIRVGFRKAKGKLVWADAGQVIRAIRKHMADQAAVLIKTTEAPVRAALEKLPAADLKRLGISVEQTGDVAIVEQTDGEVEKLVDALLSGGDAEEERGDA